MTHHEKDADGEREGGKTPFERFEEFARRVISVPREEIDARERAYRERRAREKEK